MLLLSLILAHLIADFFMQSDEMASKKMKYIHRHLLHHVIFTSIVVIGFWLYSYPSSSFLDKAVLPITVILVTHYAIDYVKIKLVDSLHLSEGKNLKLLYFFIVDQLLHLFVLILTSFIFFRMDVLKIAMRLFFADNGRLSPVNSLLLILIIIVLATSVSGHLIRILLGSIPNQLLTFEGKYAYKNEWTSSREKGQGLTEEYHYSVFNKHDLTRGKLIGYIERLLVILLTFYNAFPAIGFIVAAKSIARFKQMDDRDWAEYFLLGTLSSMFLGITLGIILKEALT